MDKSKELEIIAKYNLDNKTNFYKMDQVLDHIYKNAKAKDDALSRIAAGQIAQTEGPGATIGSDIASGKVDNVQDILTKYGISPEDAKQYSLNTARDKDTKSTKQAAGITTTAMMTTLPILDIAKYGWISGLGRNVAGAVGGALGGYYGNKADEALNTNFLGITGGLLGGGLGYGIASFRPYKGIEVSKPYVRVAPSDGRQQMAVNYTGFTPREDFTISVTPIATRSTGRTNYSLLERPSRISTAERLGLPRGERNQPKVATTWRQGDDAVKMFRDYGGIEAQEGSPLMEQIKLYVPEARERYGLVGNTNISDTEIAQSLYKRALQLSGTNNGAVYASGEPIILFRGDTRRFHTLKPRMSPDELATNRGTMDNALGNLFLGEYPNNWVGNDRYMGTIRNFGGDFSWEGSGTGSKILSKFVDLDPMEYVIQEKPRLLYSGTVGRQQRPISVYKAPASAMESGVNDLNAFIVKSPSVRDATSEISVLNDDLLTQGFRGTTPHMRTKLIQDEYGFPLYLHPDGSTTPALAGYENRIGMAEHYNYVLNDAKNKGQGLLMSSPGAVLRDEHSGYTYYALPNFNIRNAKHLLGYDLTQPVEKSWAIYRKQGGKL